MVSNSKENESEENQSEEIEITEGKKLSRREFLKMAGAFGALATLPIIAPINKLVNASEPPKAQGPPISNPGDKNPYGGGPGTGISLPPYYKPTPSVANNNTYFPGMEKLGPDEMRISFMGSFPHHRYSRSR